ncbi:MAG: glycosyltransferase [Planctomycetota bacterium]
MGEPTVSVVVPNYRHERFLAERLESILNQTFGDYEVVLLDDASPDGSVSVLERYAGVFADRLGVDRVQTCFNRENSGNVFRQWARGVSMARGRYVWIAESDDSAEPELLETLVGRLDRGVDEGLVFCDSQKIDGAGEVLGGCAEVLGGYLAEDWSEARSWGRGGLSAGPLAALNCVPNAGAVVCRRAVLEAVLAEEDPSVFRLCGDWLVWWACAERVGVGYEPAALNKFRHHTATVRESVALDTGFVVEALSLVLAFGKRCSVEPRYARQGGVYWRWRLGVVLKRRGPIRVSSAGRLAGLMWVLWGWRSVGLLGLVVLAKLGLRRAVLGGLARLGMPVGVKVWAMGGGSERWVGEQGLRVDV